MPVLRAPDGSGRPHLSGDERTPGASLSDALPEDEILAILQAGELHPLGLMPRASNSTLLCELTASETKTLAVYKPRSGESPLWDFPDGTLCLREQAAYVASRASGWDLVPPTVLRDGPYGFGAVQLFIDARPGEHYLTLARRFEAVFMRVAALDIAINNADRKSGHCLLQTGAERVWFVDHGVTFHSEPKLRTVIWDFAGEAVPPDVLAGLARLRSALSGSHLFDDLLSGAETSAALARIDRLTAEGEFPAPSSPYSYPWPPV